MNKTIEKTFFEVKIASFSKLYPVVAAAANPNVGIVYLYDLNDNYTLTYQIAKILSNTIFNSGILEDIEALIMPGDSANMLGTLLFQNLLQYQANLEFCIIRASAKGGSFKHVEYQSMTSTAKKTLHLREDQFYKIANKNVLIFDDIISSGATLNAMTNLAFQANAKVLSYACFATEGNSLSIFQNKPLFKISHLPIFKLSNLV